MSSYKYVPKDAMCFIDLHNARVYALKKGFKHIEEREKQREKVCTVEKGIMNAVGFTRCCRPSPLKEKLNTSDHETAVNPHTHKHIRATTDLPGHR